MGCKSVTRFVLLDRQKDGVYPFQQLNEIELLITKLSLKIFKLVSLTNQ